MDLVRSRFVRRDLSGRSGRGHLILACAEHRRPRPLLKVNKLRQQHRWAKIVLRCIRADQDLIMNAEHFAWTDLDRSRFD